MSFGKQQTASSAPPRLSIKLKTLLKEFTKIRKAGRKHLWSPMSSSSGRSLKMLISNQFHKAYLQGNISILVTAQKCHIFRESLIRIGTNKVSDSDTLKVHYKESCIALLYLIQSEQQNCLIWSLKGYGGKKPTHQKTPKTHNTHNTATNKMA